MFSIVVNKKLLLCNISNIFKLKEERPNISEDCDRLLSNWCIEAEQSQDN